MTYYAEKLGEIHEFQLVESIQTMLRKRTDKPVKSWMIEESAKNKTKLYGWKITKRDGKND